MLKLRRHKEYLKDFKKQAMSEKHYATYIVYLSTLLQNQPLPPQAIDHALKGEYADFREFHISGDLLVIYAIKEDSLELYRIGSHAQLFK